jgi:hypothetical protein
MTVPVLPLPYPDGMTDISLRPWADIPRGVIVPKARTITGTATKQTQPLALGEHCLTWGKPRPGRKRSLPQRLRLVSTKGWALISYEDIASVEISDSTGSKISFGRVAALGPIGLLARKRKVTARVVITATRNVFAYEVDGWNGPQLANAFRPITSRLADG